MKSTIQQLAEIEKIIFELPYDELTPYLQGIRDMINLLNNEEQKDDELLINTVMHNLININK